MLTPRRATYAVGLPSPCPALRSGVTRVHAYLTTTRCPPWVAAGLDNFIRGLRAARRDPAGAQFLESASDLRGRGFSSPLLLERQRALGGRWKMPSRSLHAATGMPLA